MVPHGVGRFLCSWCAAAVLILVFELSSAQPAQEEATCTLKLQGNGPTQQGIATAALACTSNRPVAVLINTTYLPQASNSISGAIIVSSEQCKAATTSMCSSGVMLPPAFPLLTFCNGSITLQQPIIQDLWINPEPLTYSGSPVVLAFAGNSSTRIVEGNFSNNNAGSILLLVQQASVDVYNTVFDGNIALRGAAALALDRSKLTIVDTTFTNLEGAVAGGALYLTGSSVTTISNSSFTRNLGLNNGGVLAVFDKVQTNFYNCLFHENAVVEGAEAGGNWNAFAGVLYSVDNAHTTISNSIMFNNTATSGGCIFLDYNSTLTVQNSQLDSNSAVDVGGVLNAGSTASAIFSNCTVHNNRASVAGGAFGVFGDASLYLDASVVAANVADQPGGAVFSCKKLRCVALALLLVPASSSRCHCDACRWLVSRCQGSLCSSCSVCTGSCTLGVPSIELERSAVPVCTGNCTLRGNAICVSCEVSRTTFQSNSADSGGAIQAQGNALLTLTDSSLVSNAATSFGGALSVIGSSWVEMQGCNSTNNTADVGGFLSTSNSANTSIMSSRFMSNNASDGGALHADGSAEISVAHTYFGLNNASEGGAVGCADSTRVTLADGTVLVGNNASLGGGVYAFGSCNLTLQGGTAVLNGTADKGAGIALSNTAQLFVSSDVVVIFNDASVSGGGMYLASPLFSARQLISVVHNNTAPVNDNVAVVATNLSMLGSSSGLQYVARLGSENMLPVTLNVTGHQGLPVEGELAQCMLIDESVQDPQFLGVNRSADGGVTHLNLRLWKPPGTYMLSCYTPDSRAVVPANVSLYIRACTRGEITPSPDICQVCPPGYYSFNPEETVCRACPAEVATCQGGAQLVPVPGAWRSAANSTQVHRCPNPSACRPLAGSAAIMACEVDSDCRQSSNFSDVMCTTGYEGNLCGVCAPGYGSFKPFSCRQCMPNSTILGLYITASIIMLIFMKILVEVTMSANQETAAAATASAIAQHDGKHPTLPSATTFHELDSSRAAHTRFVPGRYRPPAETETPVPAELPMQAHAVRKSQSSSVSLLRSETLESVAPATEAAAVAVGHSTQPSLNPSDSAVPKSHVARLLPSDLLRPLLLYSQYILVIGSMSIDFPETISYPIRALAWFWSPASPGTLSADCLMRRNATVPFAIQRVLFYLLMPVVMLVVLLAIEAAILKFKHKMSVRVGMAHRLGSAVLVSAFFFLPSVSNTIFSLFACVPIDQPPNAAPYTAEAVGSWWSVDLNAQCWHGYHLRWAVGLGVPLLLLVCCGMPAGILYRTLGSRQRLQDPRFLQHYGFLYRAYKPEYCWWEAVIAVQTMVLVAVSVFGASLGPYFQGLVMNAALAIAAMLLLACKPHAHFVAYRISLYAVCCLLFTSYTSLSFLPYGTLRAGPVYAEIMGSLVLLVNIVFVFYVGYKLYRQVDWRGLLQTMSVATNTFTSKASGLLSSLSNGELGKQLTSKPSVSKAISNKDTHSAV